MAQTVLVIDDQRNTFDLVTTALAEQGHRITIASDATAGIEKVISEKPDLLILGLGLPDGLVLLQHLRDDPQIPRLPVIMILKSRWQETDIRKGWDLGVDAYLTVPFNPLELRAYVKRIFKSIDEDQDAEAIWPTSLLCQKWEVR